MSASLLAALTLGVAVVVVAVSPIILAAPNVLSTPSALIVAVGGVGALAGGSWGRRVAMAVSLAGLLLSVLWLWFARDGFGKGVPWWDDIIEAGILAGLFAVAIILLRRHPT